jgi:predicted cobalt transporter CbtA
MVVVPFVAYPPLLPGVESGLAIEARQWLFAACVAVGATGAHAAIRAWRAVGGPGRWAAAAGLLAAPVVLAAAALPDQRAGTSPEPGLVTDFRIATVASQLAFWLVLGGVGAALLPRAAAGRAGRRWFNRPTH